MTKHANYLTEAANYLEIVGPNFLKFGGPDGLLEAPDPPGRALDASWAAIWPGSAGNANFFRLLDAITEILRAKLGAQNCQKST